MSLARKHKIKMQQLEQKAVVIPSPTAQAETGDSQQGALPAVLQKLKDGFAGDRKTLKILNGDQQRLPFKKELIEKYRPLCNHFMVNFNDWARLDSLFWWLLWRSDLEPFEQVEPDLYKAVQHGLTTPIKGFERDWQTTYSDLVYLYFEQKLKAGEKFESTCLLKLVADINNGNIIVNGPLKAKIYAIYGKVTMRAGQYEIAIKAFKAALSLNEKVGVKKLLKECEFVLGIETGVENE